MASSRTKGKGAICGVTNMYAAAVWEPCCSRCQPMGPIHQPTLLLAKWPVLLCVADLLPCACLRAITLHGVLAAMPLCCIVRICCIACCTADVQKPSCLPLCEEYATITKKHAYSISVCQLISKSCHQELDSAC